MSDMVEKVARRLCIQRGGHPDDTARVEPHGGVVPMPKGWRAWHDHVGNARELVAEMREPTLEMRLAGAAALDGWLTAGGQAPARLPASAMYPVYVAMNGAALKEGKGNG